MRLNRSSGKLDQLRYLLTLALLSGLIVSSGEGLRLFPIPAPEGFSGSVTTELSAQRSSGYQFAVHRFGNSANTLGSKLLKKKKTVDSVDPGTQSAPRSVRFLELTVSSNFTSNTISVSSGLLLSPDGRAPPLA